MDDLIALATECEVAAEECARRACGQSLGGQGSMEWIAEAAHYSTVAASLRARAATLKPAEG